MCHAQFAMPIMLNCIMEHCVVFHAKCSFVEIRSLISFVSLVFVPLTITVSSSPFYLRNRTDAYSTANAISPSIVAVLVVIAE